MRVVTTTLEMREPPERAARPLPDGVRLERVLQISPEYARFLYGLVGGPWHWTERLGWSRQQWLDELANEGEELWVLYRGGAPAGYVQLHPTRRESGLEVEIRYFGLAEDAIGHGYGGLLLEHGLRHAWTVHERSDLPRPTRVWVHTCTLDGPAALANYQARGMVVTTVEEDEQDGPDQPLGSWVSSGGPRS
ncbi:GNAT family N-acetyltransferase [Microlunatus antarcticus]|uniref:GNAT superfamily N-acetyltransferase n=1 Tax=Microlunatus antarcticus TaxID=53388 RepID=A0A7W5JXM4_9ACTN|nr:GNAT family N-acetyltransferase [Microlunatus antarcticus]MBB3328212.1 GNAT superfamily N-acetyltransferase [Microlunatus antarcticus]